ncbi:MAG: Enoyl-(acyl-carrier-protein) reductase (NADH) FabI [Firmicutes bacterium ADurb.Bin419]|nr:MAG: Enoyl-(acyl-carrier-protein) reductase (NADH) FabI [Firmicutes bacterium ADurb.Bin419]
MGSLLANKNILIMGVRNKWSIAWGIVKAAQEEGARVILTYLGEREKGSVEELGGDSIFQCDISVDKDIDNLFSAIREKYGVLHGVVHSIAHANSEDLQRDFVYTSREGFAHALDVSAYSLVAVARAAKELMTEGGSIITLTYMGSEKVLPNYNIMGVAKAALEASVRYLASDLGPQNIRVNAISAGPVKTLSAKGVKDFGNIMNTVEEKAPLRRNITQQDLGKNALYLLSELSSGCTGEIIHVDSGYNIMGI